MERRFYTFALAQALSEAGDDYVDTFVPFLLTAVSDSGPSSGLRDVQVTLSDRFSLTVPEAVLETVATRAKRRGYLTQTAKTFALTESGRSYRGQLEPEADVSRRINALFEDMSAFFASKGLMLTREETETLLIDFLGLNVEPLMEFVAGNPRPQVSETGHAPTDQERLLIEYVRVAEAGKPAEFETLRQMVLGALVAAVLQSREAAELTDLRRRKLREMVVYLDTNFLFSILQLHPAEFAKPALELFGLLRDCGIEARVFSFTVDEACRVLGGYLSNAYRYPSNVRIDTLYSSLRTQGWTKFQIQQYIANIEENLEREGIAIEPVLLNLRTYDALPADRAVLVRYKPEQPEVSQNHDLAAIAQVRKARGRTLRRFEDSKAFFLTSDIRLTRFCHQGLSHSEHGTIAEVILDKLLTNILWLKNPGIEAPLRMLIAAYSRDLFVKRVVWDRFYQVLRQLRAEGKATDDRIAGLFYGSYVEEVLLQIDEASVARISEDFVLQEIEKAAQQRDQDELTKLKAQEREFLGRLDEASNEAEAAREREWTNRLEGIRSAIGRAVEGRGTKIAAAFASLGTLAAFLAAVGIFLLAENQDWTEPVQFFLPIIIGGASIFSLWKYLYGAVKRRYVRSSYSKRIKEAGLAWPDDPDAESSGEPR